MLKKYEELYDTVIGLEIHAELKTKSKIFCSCPANFENEMNKNCCPICMGHPGTLPTLNKSVVEYAIKMGYATKCKINNIFTLDRKNYFYPDLPKSYQISQFKKPICQNGVIEYYSENIKKKVKIKQIHIEEDAGKLNHLDNGKTILDFNRCGVPLIEIVTEHDLQSAKEARDFLENISIILKYLNICDCKMEEGSLRCDVNISLKNKDSKKLGTRVELKNINSFSAVYRSIQYEIERQYNLLINGQNIIKETRRWNDENLCSISMRNKEQENDYKYFQDPDFFHFKINDDEILNLKTSIPKLHLEKYEKYINKLNISSIESFNLIKDPEKSKLFDECIKINSQLCNLIVNWINYDITKYINDNNIIISKSKITAQKVVDLIMLIDQNIINKTIGKKILPQLFTNDITLSKIINNSNYKQISDTKMLENIIEKVLFENNKAIQDYQKGKTNIIGFLIGICMKTTNNRANPKIINEILINKLKNINK